MESNTAHTAPSPNLDALRTPPRLGLGTMIERLMKPQVERFEMLRLLHEAYEAHGNVSGTGLGPFRINYLFGPDANRRVLLDQERTFSARKPWMMIMGRIFPNGLLLLDGDEHKSARKIMKGAFARPALREYAERMNPMVAEGIDDWGRPDRPFLAFPAVKQLTLNMAARIFVGIELGPETTRMNEALEDLVGASMSRIRLPIPGLEFQRGLAARKFMIDFIGQKIPARRSGEGTDMFSRFSQAVSEDGERLDDQQIIDHMSFLMMAAHDTTTSTLTSIFYELAKHPEWQEKVREEARGYGDRPLSFDDLDQFEQLGRVMNETLRRYPPLPVIPRVATETFAFEGYRIEEGTMVIIAPLLTHYMPDWWDDPQRFDPDRFSPGRAEHERHSHNWIPFGGGVHKCLGLRFAETQIKVILHHVLQRYRWSVPDGYTMPIQQAPISKPVDGLPLRLEAL